MSLPFHCVRQYRTYMAINQQQKDISVCHRLREQREALRLGQQEVADAVDVSLKTVGRWEKSIAIPSDKLGSLAGLGFDAVYILTGVRQPQPETSLSDQEKSLIDLYRTLSQADQQTVQRTVAALAATTSGE